MGPQSTGDSWSGTAGVMLTSACLSGLFYLPHYGRVHDNYTPFKGSISRQIREVQRKPLPGLTVPQPLSVWNFRWYTLGLPFLKSFMSEAPWKFCTLDIQMHLWRETRSEAKRLGGGSALLCSCAASGNGAAGGFPSRVQFSMVQANTVYIEAFLWKQKLMFGATCTFSVGRAASWEISRC